MAVPMLLVLAVLLAAGTIVESVLSTALSKRFVYGTWWFGLFLFLLAVNLLCSAFSRFPWKRHQTGFVITHLGIILILAGSFVTQHWGVDGQIYLEEGGSGHVFQEDHPVLTVGMGNGEEIQIPADFPFRAPSPDHPLLMDLPGEALLMVDRFLLNAGKLAGVREPGAGEKGVPAVRLVLESSFVKEDQWLLLGDRERGRLDLGPASIHLMKEGDWNHLIARGAKGVGNNALAILLGPKGALSFQVRKKGKFGPKEALEPGKDYSTGWMDMRFQAKEFRPSAVLEETYRPLPLPRHKDPEPALHYILVDHPRRYEGWLPLQGRAAYDLKGGRVSLAYGPRPGALPFLLKLTKFHIGFDPGTQKAASYASDVTTRDPGSAEETPVVISMNQPLHHSGFTLYQASYQDLGDGKFLSVFSVGKDPGIWLKYSGAVVMVLGLAFMFWFKNPAWNKRDPPPAQGEPRNAA